jgi:hypothetical protein
MGKEQSISDLAKTRACMETIKVDYDRTIDMLKKEIDC